MLDTSHCSGCPLDGLYEHPAEALGDTSAPYMLVSDTPSRSSFSKGILIANTAMEVLKQGLRTARFSTKDFYIAPQIRCPHDPTEFTTKERRLIQQKCREHLLDDIHEFRPEAVLPMGAEPSRQILGKAVKITKVRGVLEHSSELRTKVFPILSPSMVAMYPQHVPIFNADCETFGRLVDNNFSAKDASDQILGEYEIVTDLEFLIEQKPELVFFDIEATHLDFFHTGTHTVREYDPDIHGKEFDPDAAILTMQFCIEPGKAYMLVWDHPAAPIPLRRKPKLLEQLTRLLCRPETKVVGQNVKFDCNYVWANLGIRFKIAGDTLMLAALLDENMLSKSQDTLVKHYVPEMAGYADHFNATVDKSRMWEVPLPKMLDYGCLTYNSLVQLGDGSWEKIGVLVDTKYCGPVRSVRSDGLLVSSPVVAWWKNGTTSEWYKLQLLGTPQGRFGTVGPKFTSDHRICTRRGDISVNDLRAGDRVLTPEYAYSEEQRQVLLGTLLGDGGYSRRNGALAGLRVSQSSRRKAYAEWKANILMPEGYTVYENGGSWRASAAYSYRDTELSVWVAHIGLRNGVKGLSPTVEVLNELSYLGVAVWYGDDGTLLRDGSCRLYCKVSGVDGERIASWFSARLDGAYVRYLVGQGAICFSRQATARLHEKLRKYTHPAVQYKLLPEFRGASAYRVSLSKERFYAKLLSVEGVRPDIDNAKHCTRYCITVKDTHNFVTRSGVVKNCGDVDSGYLLYHALMDLVGQDKKLLNHYNRVSLPGLNTFVTVEKFGLGVDHEALSSFEALMEATVAEEEASLLAQVPKKIKRKHIDDGLKFSRSDFTLDVLFYHKDGFRLKPKVFTKTTAKLSADRRVPSTSSKDHLPYFFDECPFTQELAQYMKDSRLLGTNIKGFQNKYIHDGLVRPSYRLDVTVTGRTSSEKPNGQNFPKRGPNAKAYRRIFVPPPGYYVLEADLSQAELRIAADMANDREMLRIYQSGGDIHKATACIALGITLKEFGRLPKDEQKDWRTKAKAINFGFLYGMGWRKFIGYAKTQYGVVFTEEEAQNIREAFFDRYHALPEWHMAMREFAHRNGYVRSYSGRIRHLPMIDSEDQGVQAEAERQAINSPVQEFGSSLGVMALGRLNEEIDHRYLVPIAFVHDAIYCYVPYRYADWGAKTLKRYMQTNPLEEWFNLRMKCPIIADVSIGLNLGDTYELEGFSLDEPYDFRQLWNEEEQKGLRVPSQRIPPRDGRKVGSIYTLPGA